MLSFKIINNGKDERSRKQLHLQSSQNKSIELPVVLPVKIECHHQGQQQVVPLSEVLPLLAFPLRYLTQPLTEEVPVVV